MQRARQGNAWIWLDGDWIDWRDAPAEVSALAGEPAGSLRAEVPAYETLDGPRLFRLADHLERLLDLCRIRHLTPGSGGSVRDLARGCVETAALHGGGRCEVGPVVFRARRTHVCVLARVPDAERAGRVRERGVAIGLAAGGMAEETLALDPEGFVAQGGRRGLFVVRGDRLIAPPESWPRLAGVDRDTVLTLAEELGLPCATEPISREAVYLADEAFLTRGPAEITPVVEADGLPIGAGEPGPWTRRLSEAWLAIASGRRPDRRGWLTPVPRHEAVLV